MEWIRVTGELRSGIKYRCIPEEEYSELQAKAEQLKKEYRAWLEAAAFVYDHAICTTPTGAIRNRLTGLNIERMQALRDLKGGGS